MQESGSHLGNKFNVMTIAVHDTVKAYMGMGSSSKQGMVHHQSEGNVNSRGSVHSLLRRCPHFDLLQLM